jgi:hypothetical protein
MKLTTEDGKEYMAHFHHERGKVNRTFCTFHTGACATKERPCNTPHAHIGVTVCSPRDNFNRYAGRKIAFARAICHLSRSSREQIWEAYFKVSPPPKI